MLLPVMHDRARFPWVGSKHLPYPRGFDKRYELQNSFISLLPGKQPKGTFSIEHYSARLALHLRKDSRRSCCFELVCPGKRTYEVGGGGRRGASVLVDLSTGVRGAGSKARGGPAGLGRLQISKPQSLVQQNENHSTIEWAGLKRTIIILIISSAEDASPSHTATSTRTFPWHRGDPGLSLHSKGRRVKWDLWVWKACF